MNPAQAVYIDDLPRNVNAATECGMHGIQFTNPSALREELITVGLLPE